MSAFLYSTRARIRALGIVGTLGCLSLGCSASDKPASPGPESAPDPRGDQRERPADAGAGAVDAGRVPDAPKADFAGKVTGTIRLAKGAALPLAALPESGTKDSVIAPGCPEISAKDAKRVLENAATRGLSPVHVALTGMTASPPQQAVVHEVFIDECRLRPALIGAKVGDTLRVTNRSKASFLPLLPGDSFMQAMLPDAAREVPVGGIGAADLKCGFGSYCGESVVLAVAHSLFAVTDSEGHFTISGIPLDQELTLHAWHPLFDVAIATFKLTSEEPSKGLDLQLVPAKSKAASEPASPTKKKAR